MSAFYKVGFGFTREGRKKLIQHVEHAAVSQTALIESLLFALSPQQAQAIVARGLKIRQQLMKQERQRRKDHPDYQSVTIRAKCVLVK